LEATLVTLREDVKRMQNEVTEAERQAETAGLKVRGEMSRTLLDLETRHASQMQAIETELRNERIQRRDLEREVEALKDSTPTSYNNQLTNSLLCAHIDSKKPEPKLRRTEGQASILALALGGLDDDHDEEDDDHVHCATTNGGSYAALEELTSRLRSSKAELETLRQRLTTSEETRQKLLDALAKSRDACERLPLLERQVNTLSAENNELNLEVQGLRAEIVDGQGLYGAQLDTLLVTQAETINKRIDH